MPLAYAAEPFWTHTLPRAARRHKKLLLTAGLTLVMCLVTTFLVARSNQSTIVEMAKHKLGWIWDDIASPAVRFQRQLLAFLPQPEWSHDIESPAFQFQRPGIRRLQNPDTPATTTAVHALKEYDVFGRGDWRQREDVRNLPQQDRNDLALWLMEQAFRYCRALGDRPDSPYDWRRALAFLDRVSTTPPLQAFETLRRRLNARLGQSGTPDSQTQKRVALPPEPTAGAVSLARHPPEPPWLEDYLLGVAAELEGDDDPEVAAKLKSPAEAQAPGRSNSSGEHGEDAPPLVPRSASRALRHYDRVLARSPDSFWGHYRAAVVCFRLQQWSDATRHLESCLKRRSENATLRVQFGSCLGQLGFLDDALRECSRALESAPDCAEFYRSRAFIRASLGQTEGLVEDLRRFELFSRFLTRGFFRDPPGQGMGNPLPATVPASQRALDLDFNPVFTAQPGDPLVEPEEIQPNELDARAALALTIIHIKAGTNRFRDEATETEVTKPGAHAGTPDALAIAAAELEKILTLDPQHITARMARMTLSLEQRHFEEARNDLELVLNHPSLLAELSRNPEVFHFLYRAAERFTRYGLIPEALRIAEMAVSCSIKLKRSRGQSHYYMAKVLSVAARSDSTQIARAAKQLQLAIHANGRFKEWYEADKVFDPLRTRLSAALDQLPEIRRSD